MLRVNSCSDFRYRIPEGHLVISDRFDMELLNMYTFTYLASSKNVVSRNTRLKR